MTSALACHAPAPTLWLERWLVVLLLVGLFGQEAQATEGDLAEYQIKAAFLCKFGQYIEWPAEAVAASGRELPFVIGVMAAAVVADELEQAARGQQVHGRPVQVRRIARAAEAADGPSLVFIARSHLARAAEVLALLRDRPVLTVTESDAANPTGNDSAIVNFVVVDDKVRFDISLPAASRAGLRISARLLAVARNVHGKVAP